MLFGVLGLVIAITSEAEYSTSTTLICESETDTPTGGMGNLSLLRGLGLNFGSGGTGVTPDTYPDILMSREVRLAVVRDTFSFPTLGKRAPYVEYALRPTLMKTIKKHTIRLPGRIMASLSGTVPSTNAPGTVSAFPTRNEEIAMRLLANMVEPSIDTDTGLMTINVTTHNAKFASDLANSFLRHLADRLEYLRTQKARQNLAFIENRFADAEAALISAENDLAQFNDRNNNPQTARLKTEKSRLERQLTFKTELYSDLQTQLTQEKIEFERSRPVITILEHPAPPIDPSGPNRILLLLSSVLFGGVLAVGITLTKALVDKIKRQEEAIKIDEFKTAFADAITPLQNVTRFFSRQKSES